MAVPPVLLRIPDEGGLSDVGRRLHSFDLYWAEQCQHKLAQNLHREPVLNPVFITGTGRTASSFLHARMRREGFRVASVAEAYTLARNISGEGFGYRGGWLAWDVQRMIEAGDAESPEYGLINAHQWNDPAEDIHFDRSNYGAGWWLPHYEGLGAWGSARMFEDPAADYRHLRACAEVLGRPGQEGRWCFRSPVHLMHLPVLFAEFPDAHVIWMERASEQVLPGLAKMIYGMRRTRTENVDVDEVRFLAESQAYMTPAMADDAISKCQVPLDRIIRVGFEDITENTEATVSSILDRVAFSQHDLSRRS